MANASLYLAIPCVQNRLDQDRLRGKKPSMEALRLPRICDLVELVGNGSQSFDSN